MIEGLKPYSEYRGSGDPWLGRIPSRWGQKRLWTVSTPRVERNPGKLPLLSVFLDRGVIPYDQGGGQVHAPSLDLSAYQVVRPGDLVLNNQQAWRGSVGVSKYAGIVSPAYIVLNMSEAFEPTYSNYLFRCPRMVDQFVAASKGVGDIQRQVFWPFLRRVIVPLPSYEEQRAIARFLDHANRRIDRFIRAKRKLIALLNEQKQAIIHQAVTRGLDPNVPMKDSGVPWLGEIPAHWEVRRFKFLAAVNSGQVDPRKPQYRSMLLIAPNHVQSSSGRLLRHQTAAEQGADSGKYLVRAGQVVYSKIRPALRKATIAPVDCLCSADMYPISPRFGRMSAEYLQQILLSMPFTRFAIDTSTRVAMPKVNREALADCVLWYPSRDEQQQVLEFVKLRGAPFETSASRIEREIALIREYRTRLTADVVTGQLDARQAAARLPAEDPEPTPEPEPDSADDLEDDPE